MGRTIDQIIGGLPKERRAKIAKKSRKMAREMTAYADSLAQVRKAFGKTQVELGSDLGLAQNAVSQLESRSDIRLSTLLKYVDALGAELDLVIRSKDGAQVVYRASARAGVSRAKAQKVGRKSSKTPGTALSRR